MAIYTYSLAEDFPLGTINELQLQTEAGATSVSTYGDVVTVVSPTNPDASVVVHMPKAASVDASVSWATSAPVDLAEVFLASWRGNTIRVVAEYKTGADDATLTMLEDDVALSPTRSAPHTSGSWLPISVDFPIVPYKAVRVYTLQGTSPLFTTLQLRNISIEVARV